jgi:hypothetical protein
MAGTATYTWKLEVVDDDTGAPLTISGSKQVSFTAFEDKRFAMTADQTRIAWDPTVETTEAVTDFDFMFAVSDGNVDMELTANEGDGSETVSTVRLAEDMPFTLAADDAYYNGGFGGSLDVIDKIRFDEPASTARKVRLLLFT